MNKVLKKIKQALIKILKVKLIVGLGVLGTLGYAYYQNVLDDFINFEKHYSFKYTEVSEKQTVALINLIEKADSNDTVEIIVDNPGGRLDQLLALLDTIDTDDSQIIIKSRGMAASAAGILMLTADRANIGDNTALLFHIARIHLFGIIPILIDYNDGYHYTFMKIVSRYLSEYLTDEEIDYMLSGNDLWLLGIDFKTRGKINEKNRILTLLDAHKDMYNRIIFEKNKETLEQYFPSEGEKKNLFKKDFIPTRQLIKILRRDKDFKKRVKQN